jgi:hypothetical protein
MRIISGLMVAGLLAMAAPEALAQHGQAPQLPPEQGQTLSLQGDQSAWINNPHMREFYTLTKATLGAGAAPLAFEDYRAKSFAIFRAFAVSMGGSPEMMVDHLKDIPGQMVGIVKDDPKVLESYDSFVVALMGPQ